MKSISKLIKLLRNIYWRTRTFSRYLIHDSWPHWKEYLAALYCSPIAIKRQPARHALLLAWFFPPFVSGGVYRPTALVKNAIPMGWRISIVARQETKNPEPAGVYLANSLPQQMKILRVPGRKLRPYPFRFPTIDGGFPNAITIFNCTRNWLAQDPPDVIIATGPPFHSFVAAYLLSRFFRAKLVLDYRDEWSESPHSFVENRYWERRCLRYADRVIFTTQSQIDHYIKLFPVLNVGKCRLVQNGWEPSDFPKNVDFNLRPPLATNSYPMNVISFVGYIGNHHLPGDFLAVLEQAIRIRSDLISTTRFRFIGQKSEIAQKQLTQFPFQQILELIDHVPKPRAIEFMQTSNSLLIFNYQALARYLPGKLFEYVACGIPLLVIGTGGEVGRIVTELNSGIVCDLKANSLINALDALRHWTPLDKNRVDEWLKNHTRQATSARFVQILDELVA